MGEFLPNHHEDHVAWKGDNSLQHCNAPSHKNSSSKGSSGQGTGKLEKISAWDLTKVKSKKDGDWWSTNEGRTSSFCLTYWQLSFEESWVGGKAPKIQRSSCTPRWYCKRRFWILCSIHRARIISITNDSSKVMDIMSRLPGCAVSSWCSTCLNPGKNGRCSKIIENSKIGMSRHLDSSTTTQMAKIMVQYERSSRSSWTESVWSSFGRTILGKTIWEDPILKHGWEKVPNWECLFVHRDQDYSYLCMYDMEGHAKKCVERYCELAHKTTQQLYKVSTPCIDDHHYRDKELKSVGDLSKVWSQIVLKCLRLARVGRPVFYGQWTNLHDRLQNGPNHVTNDYPVWSLTSSTHVNTNSIVMRVILPKQCGLELRVEHCVFGSHTFVPISWMCKKRDQFFGCRIEVGRYTRAWFMGSDRRSSSRWTRLRMIKCGETRINVQRERQFMERLRRTDWMLGVVRPPTKQWKWRRLMEFVKRAPSSCRLNWTSGLVETLSRTQTGSANGREAAAFAESSTVAGLMWRSGHTQRHTPA